MFNISRFNPEGRHIGTMERHMIRAAETHCSREVAM
jgi:hypothetical protein